MLWLGIIIASFGLAVLSYMLLIDWSELAAVILSSFIVYGVIFLTANYRISRYFSVYLNESKLVLNNAFFGVMVIDLAQIDTVKLVQWSQADDKEQLKLGKGDKGNIAISFVNEQTYFGMMGQFTTVVDKIILQLNEPQALVDALYQVK